MQSKLIAPFVIGALVVGGGSFYGGMQYAKSRSAGGQFQHLGGMSGGRGGFGGPGAGVQGRAGGGFTAGEVVSKDATSFTLKLRDGGSKVVFYSSSTAVGKMAAGTADDLAQGTEVTVSGSSNQDGSITASTVQIRPPGMNQIPGRDAASAK